MKIKLLFAQDAAIRKLDQIKFIKNLFGLGLKEAKDAVDSGEFIPQCECDESTVEMIRSNSNTNIKVVILPSPTEAEKTFQLTVYSHLQNLFPQECILLNKKEYEKERKELMKYKSLYLDLVGSIHSIIDTFPKE
ncbi:hypothetical protein KNV27_gp040 [uncultured phage cr55_1]|uniref:Large ribosomal subunit protein bL12 C-terminal domain-containing protein n=1 Tax=uncultured phage cr55_1 TaxID=2772060 RepID=A0A7M1RUK9_9CAUD|nr:hypothetical protein KNV27_gp040 [uncultured phage cr55_1]QOR58115.1 hypothetical protein [uncultured phage cr55_1]